MPRARSDAPPVEQAVDYTVLDPLRHDGRDYAPGDALRMTPAEAAALLAGGLLLKAPDA